MKNETKKTLKPQKKPRKKKMSKNDVILVAKKKNTDTKIKYFVYYVLYLNNADVDWKEFASMKSEDATQKYTTNRARALVLGHDMQKKKWKVSMA